MVENEIPDASYFINTHKVNRLTKMNFDARMKEAAKTLSSKTEASNALYLENKNKKKTEKLQTFNSSYFLGKNHFQHDNRI